MPTRITLRPQRKRPNGAAGRHRARPNSIGEHLFWTIIVGVALATAGLVLVFLAGDQPARPASAAPAPAAPCAWHTQLDATLAELGERPADWTVTDIAGGYAGRSDLDRLRSYVDRDVPCSWVDSVVRHEHMHLQQGRMLGGLDATLAEYGSMARLEFVADCGSEMLGAAHTPYVDKREARGGPGCTPADQTEAQALIDFRPHVTPAAPRATS